MPLERRTFPEKTPTPRLAWTTPEYAARRFATATRAWLSHHRSQTYELASGKTNAAKEGQKLPGYRPVKYATERQWARARDGVKVPISIVYRKGGCRDGKAPLLLYAYGSYGYGMQANIQ